MNDTNELISVLKLRFNIEHPNVEECYAYGYDCAASGVGEEENPFPGNTKEHQYWLDGWWAGFYGEPPLFSVDEIEVQQSEPISIAVANDHNFHDGVAGFFVKVLEITSVLAVSALISYQVLDMVA